MAREERTTFRRSKISTSRNSYDTLRDKESAAKRDDILRESNTLPKGVDNPMAIKKADLVGPEEPEQIVSLGSNRPFSQSQSESSPLKTASLSEFDHERFKTECNRCVLEVKVFISIIKETIVRFYRIEDRV